MPEEHIPTIAEFAEQFTPFDDELWREAAKKALGAAPLERLTSRTADGIAIAPLHSAQTPTAAAGREAGPWHLAQRHDHPDPAAANKRVLTDLERGVTALRLALDWGLTGRDGVLMVDRADMDRLLKGVLLDLAPVHLEPGPHFKQTGQFFAEIGAERDHGAAAIFGSLGADPLTDRMAGQGGTVDAAADFALWARTALPNMQPLEVRAAAYYDAGATEAVELAVALATAVDYLRALEQAGLPPKDAMGLIGLHMGADMDVYLTVAKLRAARRLWSRLQELLDVPSQPLHLSAETAGRMQTRYDPWTNILRNTIACFAAGVGGAASVTVAPHDAVLGVPSGFALKIARNIQLILQEESNLYRVADPAAGSGLFETLTEDLCASAWARFTQIEQAGGMAAAIDDGLIAGWLEEARQARSASVAKRRPGIIGVSQFPDLAEAQVEPEAVDRGGLLAAARARRPAIPAQGANNGLAVHRVAEPFELLRDKAEGRCIFLITLGSLADYSARLTWARSAVAAGGLALTDGMDGTDQDACMQAYRQHDGQVVLILGPDEMYETHLAGLSEALAGTGASVWKAGKAGPADPAHIRHLFHGCDLLAALTQMLEAGA